jgi:hypothetical protein
VFETPSDDYAISYVKTAQAGGFDYRLEVILSAAGRGEDTLLIGPMHRVMQSLRQTNGLALDDPVSQ